MENKLREAILVEFQWKTPFIFTFVECIRNLTKQLLSMRVMDSVVTGHYLRSIDE